MSCMRTSGPDFGERRIVGALSANDCIEHGVEAVTAAITGTRASNNAPASSSEYLAGAIGRVFVDLVSGRGGTRTPTRGARCYGG